MKVLLINHTKTIMKAIEELDPSFSIEVITATLDSLESTVNSESPEVVILNWIEGMTKETCSAIKKIKGKKGNIYLVLLGTKDTLHELKDGVEAGADDFILIPFSKDEVIARMKIAKRVIDLNLSLVKTKKKLIKHAKEDPVTSTLNRRALIDEISNEIGRASRRGEFTCAIMINLHNHEEIQKDFGLKVFDAFLGEFASRLKKSIRPYDKIGRFEFARFLIFLPHAKSEDSKKVAERIIGRIEQKKFRFRDQYIEPCVSIGISELDPGDIVMGGDSETAMINELILESFIRRSEFATTSACEKGGNSIEIYTF